MSRSILLIGKPGSSKTVFLAQFYLRLQKRKSELSLSDVIGNISVLAPSLDALADGSEPQPTPTEDNREFLLPVVDREGNRFDLLCPEYGGEQINTIIRTRLLDKRWMESVVSSNNWLFFIRLNSLARSKDLSDLTPSGTQVHDQQNERPEYEISDQVAFIELLQLMLQQKAHDYHHLQKDIRLTIVLTCWDELETEEPPKSLLYAELPLLASFISSNWAEDMWSVAGLAALEFSLRKTANQQAYKNRGPENFGFMVSEEGTPTKDITKLISIAL